MPPPLVRTTDSNVEGPLAGLGSQGPQARPGPLVVLTRDRWFWGRQDPLNGKEWGNRRAGSKWSRLVNVMWATRGSGGTAGWLVTGRLLRPCLTPPSVCGCVCEWVNVGRHCKAL